MAHQQGPNQTIAEIYKGVINDVISQVKEAFLDESVDIDVLHQLKKDWEEKVRQSGAVDFDGPRQPVPNAPPLRQGIAPRPIPQPTVRIQQPSTQQYQPQQNAAVMPAPVKQNNPPAAYMNRPQQAMNMSNLQQQHLIGHPLEHQPPQPRPQQQLHFMQQPQMQQFQAIQVQGGVNFAHGIPQGVGVRMITGPNGQQQFVMPNGMQLQQQQVMILGGQPQAFVAANGMVPQRIILQQQSMQDQHPMHQLDGQGGLDDDQFLAEEKPCCSNPNSVADFLKKLPKPKRVKGKELKKLMKRFEDVVQVDGNGMTDSSSEDEPEEDDDPLRRMADRIGGDDLDDEEDHANEEAPLNSEDDQSDDEDLDTLFDADNVVMCQFEKVSRARQKWKFSLKDGIMHIDGRDYCFQKCAGEAEW